MVLSKINIILIIGGLISSIIVYQNWRINSLKNDLEEQQAITKQREIEADILSNKITEYETIDRNSRQILRNIKPNHELSPLINEYANRIRLFQQSNTNQP